MRSKVMLMKKGARSPLTACDIAIAMRGWCAALLLVVQGCATPSGSSARPDLEEHEGEARVSSPSAVVRINEELTAERVARDAWVVTHDAGLVPANTLVVRMPDGTVVLCSSPYESDSTRVMLRWLRETLRPSRVVAINTHFHPDGMAGNEAYREAGVETWASDLTQELFEARGAEVHDMTARAVGAPLRERMERTKLVGAARTFEHQEGLTLELGGEVVRVLYPGPAHTRDNVVVHFPGRRLLFGGCMVRAADATIRYTGDADVDRWEASVASLLPLAPEVVVPGHGASGGGELLRHTLDVVRAARSSPKRR